MDIVVDSVHTKNLFGSNDVDYEWNNNCASTARGNDRWAEELIKNKHAAYWLSNSFGPMEDTFMQLHRLEEDIESNYGVKVNLTQRYIGDNNYDNDNCLFAKTSLENNRWQEELIQNRHAAYWLSNSIGQEEDSLRQLHLLEKEIETKYGARVNLTHRKNGGDQRRTKNCIKGMEQNEISWKNKREVKKERKEERKARKPTQSAKGGLWYKGEEGQMSRPSSKSISYRNFTKENPIPIMNRFDVLSKEANLVGEVHDPWDASSIQMMEKGSVQGTRQKVGARKGERFLNKMHSRTKGRMTRKPTQSAKGGLCYKGKESQRLRPSSETNSSNNYTKKTQYQS